MAVADVRYCFEDSVYRKILYSPLKKLGFVPEKETELFVTAIPKWASVYDLVRFFEQVGELFQVKLLVEPDGPHNRGYAFVTYMNAKLAEKALSELKNTPFFGSSCLAIQKSVNNCRIFVGGLPTSKTKDEIWQELMNTYNIRNIVDVITYRNYSNPSHNRGFVFLEFRTHEEASYFRAKYSGKLNLFGKDLLVDWSVPVLETNEDLMAQVKIIFLRNLNVTLSSEEFAKTIYRLINRDVVQKVYKFKDYAYIHMTSRSSAEKLLDILKSFFNGSEVEISWAKPPNKFSERSFREKAIAGRKSRPSPDPCNRIHPSRFSSPLPHGSQSFAKSYEAHRHFMGTAPLLQKIPESFLTPSRSRLPDLYSQNIFTNADCGSSTSFSVNNQNQPSTSGIFGMPILPQNLTPFHQIRPSYPPPLQMPSPRSVSKPEYALSSSSFSDFMNLPRAEPFKNEIDLQDMEIIGL